MRKLERIGEEKVRSLLIEFSIPATIGLLVNALYQVVDRFFIGQGCGREAIAGVTLAFPFMAILNAFGMLIGVGSGALLSIRLGEQKRKAGERVVGQMIAVKIVFFTTLTAAMYFLLDPLLLAFGSTPEAMPAAREYMRICLYGNLFSHLSFGLANLLRAEGAARRSMYCMSIGAGLNLLLDPLFIFVFDWGVAGAAWATNIAMFATFVYAISFYVSRKTAVALHLRNIRIFPKLLWPVFSIGLSPFLIHMMMGVVTVAFNRMFLTWAPSTDSATIEIAALGIVSAVLDLVLMPVFGLTQGMQPIVGYNYGAKKIPRVYDCYVLGMKVATVYLSAVTVAVILFAEWIFRFFTSDPILIQTGVPSLRIYACMFFVIGIPIVSMSYFQSIGRAHISIILSLFRQLIVLVPLVLFFPHIWGVLGIWIASPASDLISAIVADTVAWKELKRLKSF